MQYLLDKYGIELYNICPFSLEDRIENLFGEVCFYVKDKIRGERMAKANEPSFKDEILLDISEIDPNNKEKINEYARDTIEYAIRLENTSRPAILSRTHKELR